MKLKFKVFFTNVSRIIMSLLFINMTWLLNPKAKAAEVMCYDVVKVEPPVDNAALNETVTNAVVNNTAEIATNQVVLCYAISTEHLDRQVESKNFLEKVLDVFVEDPEKVFFLLVPIILIIVAFAVVMYKRYERKKLEKKVNENDIKQDENK